MRRSGLSPHFFILSSGTTVRDLGPFTRGKVSPFCLLISLENVFSIVRQHWVYEMFSEYSAGLDSVTIVKLRSRYNSRTKVRLLWDNRGPQDRSEAQVLFEREWKDCKYRNGSVHLKMLTDLAVVIRNYGRVLIFH